MAEFNGPLFNGQAEAIAAQMVAQVEREVADEGVEMVKKRLIQVIKKPTPYYWTQIHTLQRRGGTEVTGENVIYHWWLEGVGSRNYPVTRFKGYGTFRLVTPALRARCQQIAALVMIPFLDRMGGR